MHASVHDRIIVLSPQLDEPNRDGEILEVRGIDGAPPYRVQWSDTGHEGLYYPGPNTVIHHDEAGDEAADPCRSGPPPRETFRNNSMLDFDEPAR